MPEAIKARSIDDGPTSGTTLMLSFCAIATIVEPGSATAGQHSLPLAYGLKILRVCVRVGVLAHWVERNGIYVNAFVDEFKKAPCCANFLDNEMFYFDYNVVVHGWEHLC